MASLVEAEHALRSTSAKANFQRLTRLLMCGGLQLLRETLDSIHSPADLPLRLGDPTIQTQLRGARLTPPQWNCLYPSPGVYGKSTDFDITLTFRLLRTICNLTPPPGPRGWDSLPNSSDHSLEADLVRIKYYRNEVYAHSKTMEITNTEFSDLWGKISEALLRIAAAISHEKKDEWKKSIDDYLHKPLTPAEDRCTEQLNKRYKEDMDHVKTELAKLIEEVKTMKEDMKKGFAKQPQRHPSDTFEKGLVKTSEVDHGILASESRAPLLEKIQCEKATKEVLRTVPKLWTRLTCRKRTQRVMVNQEELPYSCQRESKLLSSLWNDQPYLHAVSECLDTTLLGVGNYRAVAQHYGLSHYRISSFLEKHHSGPTTALIENLAATRPKLTVQAFTAVVRQKAKRRDVANLLEAYDSGKKLKDVYK